MLAILTYWLRVAAPLRLRLELSMFCFCFVALFPVSVDAADSTPLEYAVKAAYLYKFGIYVEWPRTVFASPTSALNLCIVGDDPFGSTLDEAVKNQFINGRPIEVRRLMNGVKDSGCHILYLGAADMQQAAARLEAVSGNGVLTVSNFRGIGIINFVIKDNRVRFDIDDEAAANSGLRISSKLLSLALSVKPRPGGQSPVQ